MKLTCKSLRHWISPTRSFPDPIRCLPGDLWNPALLCWDVFGAVQSWKWSYMLEEYLSSRQRSPQSFFASQVFSLSFSLFTVTCRLLMKNLTEILMLLLLGLGYGQQLVVFYYVCHYIVILAWAFLYLFSSFNTELLAWNTGTSKVSKVRFYLFNTT